MTDLPSSLLARPARMTLLTLSVLLGFAGAQQTAPPTATPPAASGAAAPAASLTPLLESLRGAPDWRAADLNYRAAQLTLDSARTRAGLSVTAGVDGSLTRVPWDSGTFTGATTLTVNASLNVLPWAPALEGARSAARSLAGAAVDLRNTRARLTVQALQAYEGVRGASGALELSRAQLDLARAQLSAAQSQRSDGVLSAEGLLAQQAAFENAQAAQTRAERTQAQALRSLNRLLGAPVTLPAQAGAFAPLPTVTVNGTLPELLDRALSRRPEVARAQAALADAQAGLSAAQLDARFPDVTASVRAGQLSDATGNSGRVFSGTLNVKQGTLGAQVSVPLKDTSAIPGGVALSLSASLPVFGNTRGTALTQAQLGVTQAQLALDSARQSVELDVRAALDALQNEQDALNAARTTAEQARTALDSARARLNAGLGTALNVRQAELTSLQADQALQSQLNAVTLATLTLAQATTDLDPLLLTSGGTP
ncbi:TolC family protein [Deinococcus knuensis]|uniref:TolC family protein n=1 Tax=Deinococcus knuensis TaxID=1837380 RepID=A0ABQ2SD92_9DEIO|nr:TolC family protein [Deinococcus knuensis]GGS22288.1 hypothetical protein GCM10008961_12220 [Deinococcus knuensis]